MELLHAAPHFPLHELLYAVDQLLHIAHGEVAHGGFSALLQPVSLALQAHLQAVCDTTFSAPSIVPSTVSFVREFAAPFLNDFAPQQATGEPNASFAASLQELLQRLLLWKSLLLARINTPTEGALMTDPHLYSHVLPGGLDVPGMRINTVQVVQACPSIHSIRLHQAVPYREQHAWRHVDFIDERGQTHRFFLEQVSPAEAILEECSLSLQVFFELICANSHPVQTRHLHPSLASYVSIAPTVRLVRCPQYGSSLEGVYMSALKEDYDVKQMDYALRLFVLNHAQSDIPTQFAAWAKEVTKENTLEEVCDDAVLTRFMCPF